MSRRILKSLPIALVLGLAYPVQAAVAKPVDDQMSAAVVQTSSSPITSEKTAGLVQVVQPAPLVSEKTTGLVQPFTADHTTLVATNDSFDWGDAGIGAGALFGTMLLGAAGVLTLRRHRGTLAH
jgi:hypothetical protein